MIYIGRPILGEDFVFDDDFSGRPGGFWSGQKPRRMGGTGGKIDSNWAVYSRIWLSMMYSRLNFRFSIKNDVFFCIHLVLSWPPILSHGVPSVLVMERLSV